MSFTEINVFGVYVAPISLLLRHVWHPALFVFAVYMTVLSSMVLIVAR